MGRSNRPKPVRLAEKLKHIRLSLGLTLDQMIKRLDYKQSPLYPANVSEYESGKREPPLLLLLAYARVAGISTDVLIDDNLNIPKKLPKHKPAK
jgi:transcriptional regulator with XRE-family HTH domain